MGILYIRGGKNKSPQKLQAVSPGIVPSTYRHDD
ncbi:hypothetical protein KAI36_01666 [Paenibacillus sp. S02]|jgi:hypothetical protein|nr:hypothetical protein KAI36_01666 [Paenibacillus sp. S02]